MLRPQSTLARGQNPEIATVGNDLHVGWRTDPICVDEGTGWLAPWHGDEAGPRATQASDQDCLEITRRIPGETLMLVLQTRLVFSRE